MLALTAWLQRRRLVDEQENIVKRLLPLELGLLLLLPPEKGTRNGQWQCEEGRCRGLGGWGLGGRTILEERHHEGRGLLGIERLRPKNVLKCVGMPAIALWGIFYCIIGGGCGCGGACVPDREKDWI